MRQGSYAERGLLASAARMTYFVLLTLVLGYGAAKVVPAVAASFRFAQVMLDEVLHGPVSLVEEDFPVLCFAAADAAEASVAETADALAAKHARAFVTSGHARRATRLDHVRTGHPLADPISLIVSFYATVERVAAARGIDPDAPRHLSKVTATL